jgi:tRNA uridine 5-carbamoylmethylation protein Kti12
MGKAMKCLYRTLVGAEANVCAHTRTDETVTNRGGARTMAQLARIRRQYIAYTKAHTIDEDRIASTFVNFVNHNV